MGGSVGRIRGGWGASRHRVYFPGATVGGWTLVREVAPVGRNKRWRARCSCGRIGTIYPAQVRDGATCRACYELRVDTSGIPYECRTCGKVGPEGFRVGSVRHSCMACTQAAGRNGRHACGRAIRYTLGHPSTTRVRPCACGVAAPDPVARNGRVTA